MDAATAALVFGAIIALVKVIEKKYDKRNGNKSVLTADERRTLYDTGRSAEAIVDIGKAQTKILGGMNTRLAVMDERQTEIRNSVNKIGDRR